MLLMFLCTHVKRKESESDLILVGVSQLFHKICKLAFFNLLAKLDQRKWGGGAVSRQGVTPIKEDMQGNQ